MVLETLEVLPCWELDRAELQCLGLASSSVPHNYMLATRGAVTPFRLYKRVDNRSLLLLKPWITFFSQSQFAHLIVALHSHLLLNQESSRTWAISLTWRRGANTERTLHKSIWITGLQSTIKPRQPKVYVITSFVTSTEPDTVLTLLETGNEEEQ